MEEIFNIEEAIGWTEVDGPTIDSDLVRMICANMKDVYETKIQELNNVIDEMGVAFVQAGCAELLSEPVEEETYEEELAEAHRGLEEALKGLVEDLNILVRENR